jgi:hypothetical protein
LAFSPFLIKIRKWLLGFIPLNRFDHDIFLSAPTLYGYTMGYMDIFWDIKSRASPPYVKPARLLFDKEPVIEPTVYACEQLHDNLVDNNL